MTRWGGHVVGRISLLVVIAVSLGVHAPAGVEAQGAQPSTEVTLPPVTLPPVTLPPVTLPPVTVPPGLTDPLPPSIGGVLDGTTGTVDDVVGQVGGLLSGGGTAPPGTNPPPATAPTPSTDPDPGARPGRGGSGGTEDVGGAGGQAPAGSDQAAAGRAQDDGRSPAAPGTRRALRRLASSGASLTAVDLPLAPADPLDDAVRRDARRFGWPLVLGLLIVAFLAFQHRADRHERKLADAPLDQGERLRFK